MQNNKARFTCIARPHKERVFVRSDNCISSVVVVDLKQNEVLTLVRTEKGGWRRQKMIVTDLAGN